MSMQTLPQEDWYSMLEKMARSCGLGKEDAQDVAQEAVLAYYHLRQKAPWEEKGFQPILLRTLLHGCIANLCRKSKRETVSLNRVCVEDLISDAEQEAIRCCFAKEIIQAIPTSYRLLIHLRLVEELSWREIADRLGKPIGTVSVQYERALKMARKKLGIECRKTALSSDSMNSSDGCEEMNHDIQTAFDGDLPGVNDGKSNCSPLNFPDFYRGKDGGGVS